MDKRRMLSRTPETCKAELHWTVLSMWLLGAMSVAAIMERGGTPLSWSVALARKKVRAAMRSALTGRTRGGDLGKDLATAVKDTYQRHSTKKAHDWPHKKREKPPGAPKIRVANAAEIKKAQQLGEEKAA
jgi:hypothetical protein